MSCAYNNLSGIGSYGSLLLRGSAFEYHFCSPAMLSFTPSLISTSIIRAIKLFLYTKRELSVSRCFNDLQTARVIGHMDPATEQSEQISLSKSVGAHFCKAPQATIWTCSQRLCDITTRLKVRSRRNRLPMRSRRGIDRSELTWIMCVSIRA